jgi:hypothetical protein
MVPREYFLNAFTYVRAGGGVVLAAENQIDACEQQFDFGLWQLPDDLDKIAFVECHDLGDIGDRIFG